MEQGNINQTGNVTNSSTATGVMPAPKTKTSAINKGENQMTPELTLSKATTESKADMGLTKISDNVVAKIAGIAAREIKGVHSLVPMGFGGAITGFAQKVAGGDMRGHGVGVEVGVREAAVDMNVVVFYGVNIPQVAEAVRRNIIERIKSLTGLLVKEVNLEVSDLYFPEDEVADKNRRVE